jgi:Ser/Thr protein kinase RdoA (MazF antagonist)
MSASGHDAILAEWLPVVGHDPRRLQLYDLLHGGVSGSFTYRLHGFDAPCVLKVTVAGSAPYVRERAQREIAFYRALAGVVPVAVPHVLADAIDPVSGASALLLAAYAAPLAAQGWQEAHFLAFARQLAALHAAFWNATEPFASAPWFRPYIETPPADVQAAAKLWQQLWHQPQFRAVFPARRQDLLMRELHQIAAAPARIPDFPRTLCHNDCHMDNLLRDGSGQLVWSDWQEVGGGYGPEDLSFFFQRAAAAGATIPVDATTTTYHQHLTALTHTTLSLEAIQQHMRHYELCMQLMQWPAYLIHAAPAQVLAHMQRIEQLAEER